MTKYNEKTYRVDDIDFDLTLKSKFPHKGGETTRMEHHEKNHQTRTRDPNQPPPPPKPKKRKAEGANFIA